MRYWQCLFLLLLSTGCTPEYPYDRPGTWGPAQMGANDANLRAMVANRQDLVAGSGEEGTVGPEAAAPVRRLFKGQRYPLPAYSASDIGMTGLQQSQPPAIPGGMNAGE
jgi:hypothetical protein